MLEVRRDLNAETFLRKEFAGADPGFFKGGDFFLRGGG